jgi:hypothetical protein
MLSSETENEVLKQEVKELEKALENKKKENEKLLEEIHINERQTKGKINDLEQYSRINNLRIDGIKETINEDQQQTEIKVLNTLNSYMPKLKLEIDDIEVGNRLGKQDDKKPRQIIFQFCSRGIFMDYFGEKKGKSVKLLS